MGTAGLPHASGSCLTLNFYPHPCNIDLNLHSHNFYSQTKISNLKRHTDISFQSEKNFLTEDLKMSNGQIDRCIISGLRFSLRRPWFPSIWHVCCFWCTSEAGWPMCAACRRKPCSTLAKAITSTSSFCSWCCSFQRCLSGTRSAFCLRHGNADLLGKKNNGGK